MRTHIRRGWIAGILASLMLLVGVVPAGAHAELDSSDPVDGATLATAPSALTFTFGEDVLEQGNAITLTVVDSGSRLELGPLDVDGDVVSVDWPAASPPGTFRAAYRVVSADGHPIDGSITFTVEQAVGAAESTPSAVAESPAPVMASAAAVSASPTPTGEAGAGSGPLAWIIWLGLAVLIGVGAGAWVMRRTR
jgi:methionine-rich copper-binding protein CopC